jgi:hypothetical protein
MIPAKLAQADTRPMTAARVYTGPKLQNKRGKNGSGTRPLQWQKEIVLLLISEPANRGRNARTNATNAKEDTKVLYTSRDIGELDDIADYAD